MQVAITGAAGKVGRVVAEEFEADRRTLLTHSEHEDLDSRRLDATDLGAFVDALGGGGSDDGGGTDGSDGVADDGGAAGGVDALVHLAWAPADRDRWDDGDAANVRMTANALEAARRAGVDRVVVASSAHVVGMYNRDDPDRFESTAPNPTTTVHPETPTRPDSFYGVAKVAVEGLGRYYADRHGLDVVAVRVGWLMARDELRETRSGPDDRHRFARATWLSHPDCRAIFRAAVEAPLDESPVIAHGVSRNGGRFLGLTETMQRLDYRPQDDAAEVLES